MIDLVNKFRKSKTACMIGWWALMIAIGVWLVISIVQDRGTDRPQQEEGPACDYPCN